MLINKTIETPEGTVRFEGELEEKELDLVIQIGLNYLLQNGLLPFTVEEDGDDYPEIHEADENNPQ